MVDHWVQLFPLGLGDLDSGPLSLGRKWRLCAVWLAGSLRTVPCRR